MTALIQQMARKSRCRHEGYLTISSDLADSLASEIADYCRHPDPAALAASLRAGHCQMFGVPVRVQD